MKEKIGRLAKGSFDYKNPEIHVSSDHIVMDAACGESHAGSFEVRSLNGIEIRAMVFSSSRWMNCLTKSFTGETAQVRYAFDASSCQPGDRVDGKFILVSNGGEIEIPFTVNVQAPACETSVGRINDLDDFADLAQQDWKEALELFESEDFEKIFLHSRKNRRIYETLIMGRDSSLAMEEFLCATFHKEAVSISVSADPIEYMDLTDSVTGKLVIEKSSWGHVDISVAVKGSFITVYKKNISENDFLGRYYQLEYRVRPTIGRRTEGAIVLETFGKRIEVPVRSCYSYARTERDERRRTWQRSFRDLIRDTVAYEFGNLPRNKWLDETRENIAGCLNNSSSTIFRIMEAAYLLDAGQWDEASVILEGMSERELRYRSEIEYIFYLYINARFKRDEHYTELVHDTIRYYADGQLRDRWEPAVILVRLERPAGSRAVRAYERFSRLFENGAFSPLMYAEVVKIINNEPSILREIGPFERSIFIWGVRYETLSRESVFQYVDLSMHMKEFCPEYMHALMKACETYESKEMLGAVMQQLYLGGCRSRRYNRWYALGIESALRTPELYENYMATLDLDKDTKLPYAALIYFQYDNRLPDRQRSYLYRYIVENREIYESLFNTYNGIIRSFVFDQLARGAIDPDLAKLYTFYLHDEALSPHVLRELPSVMFKQRLIIGSGMKIRRVVVNYEEIDNDLYYEPDGSNEIYVDLFLDDYRILFEDMDGGRHAVSVDYRLEKLMDAGRYIRACYDECPNSPSVLLNRSERALKYQMMDDTSISVYKRTIALRHVSAYYKKTVLKSLIDFYYDSYEGETLEKYLLQIDLRLLDREERSSIIEYYIQRGLFEKAYGAVQSYGYENIRIKRVMRLCSRTIRVKDFQEEEFLVGMSAYAFENGRYDETILNYLNRYYTGPVGRIYDIWRAARDFEVATFELEERFLCEALFTGKMLSEACEVFIVYYGEHPDMKVTRAFLALYSYRYLTGKQEAVPEIFRIIEIELSQMEAARDIASLAMLRYIAVDAPSDDATGYVVDIYAEVSRFIERGIVFPFFRKFAGRADVPAALVDMDCVICTSEPGQDLYVKYTIGGEDARMEPLVETIGGIYTRGFRLLPGSRMDYSICVGSSPDGRVIETGTLTGGEANDPAMSGVDNVRRMIRYASEGDEQSLEEEIRSYDRFDEMTGRLLHLKEQ